MVLPRLTVLDRRYAIGRALDANEPLVLGYQAWNLHTEDQVILEEFFPASLVHRLEGGQDVEATDAAHEEVFRYGRNQFLKETAVLAAVNHPNLVDVVERFEANNTAYRVLSHHSGATLASVLTKQGGKLPLKTAFSILMPLLDGLKAAHQRGLIHGAFSPQAVFLVKGRGPMLRGFRTTHVMLAQRTGDRGHLITGGLSAPEQYKAKGRQGPWTDIYSIAATLYLMLTGEMLPDASRRLEEDEVPALLQQLSMLPEEAREVVGQALSLDLAQRPRSVQSFQKHLLEAVTKKSSVAARPAKPKPVEKPAPAEAKETPSAAPPEPTIKEDLPQEPVVEAPVVEAPVVEAPVVKEPVVEEPVVKEPVVEEPVAEEPVVEEPVVEAPVAEEPVVEAPVAEEPVVEAPVVEAPVVEEVVAEPVDPVPAVIIEPEIISVTDDIVLQEPEPKVQPGKPSVIASDKRADKAAQEVAAQAAKKQAEKLLVKQLAAKKQETEEEEAPSKRQSKRMEKLQPVERTAVRSRRGMPVLAAVAVVVLVAFSGAYVLMQGENNEVAQFAHYKAKGDSLFAVANYMDAKKQYEFALAAAPNNEYVTGRLNETQQRLVEVKDLRYVENLAKGDELYNKADSLLEVGDTLDALSFFSEANKAYYEALRYRPNDPVILEKGKLASAGMEEALRRSQVEGEPETPAPDPAVLREELYNSYRQQGDQALSRANYPEAREKYTRALNEKPGDTYITDKIKEIDDYLEASGLEEQFEELIEQGLDLSNQGSYVEAKEVFKQALDIKPDDQRALDGLSRAESKLEDVKREELFQQFREQGDTYAGAGEYRKALAQYEQAGAAKPDDSYVQQKIREMQQTVNEQRQDSIDAARAAEVVLPPDGIYTVVDQAPELIGGLKELHNKVKYPDRALRMSTEGRVYVQFVVTEEGQVQDAAVIRGIGDGCDEEALRVVKEAQFVPGQLQGVPVKVRHTLFVTFKLK